VRLRVRSLISSSVKAITQYRYAKTSPLKQKTGKLFYHMIHDTVVAGLSNHTWHECCETNNCQIERSIDGIKSTNTMIKISQEQHKKMKQIRAKNTKHLSQKTILLSHL